jgi:hypothetical protein
MYQMVPSVWRVLEAVEHSARVVVSTDCLELMYQMVPSVWRGYLSALELSCAVFR